MVSTKIPDIQTRYRHGRKTLEHQGQLHLLRWWDELTPEEKAGLLNDIETIPWDVVRPLIASHIRRRPAGVSGGTLEPAKVIPAHATKESQGQYDDARERGRKLLAAGKVAAFTVAGGQGTRLGFDGPKGCVAVTPTGDLTLFELFGAMVKAASTRYEVPIPWYVMTSAANHDETVAYFEGCGYFGLNRKDVMIFRQGMLPAFDFSGAILLAEKHRVALAPDGHGGSLKALVRSGALEDMRKRGIEIISYFQVDNPLVKPFDPLFIGMHSFHGSEMSTKVTAKADDMEKVGNICLRDGKPVVVEYSEFPESLARAKNEDGSRKFDAGNLAIHLLNIGFVKRIAETDFQLPFRRAEKKVPFVNEKGESIDPEEPNAIKLETFIFDALPLAERTLFLEVDRREEFSPVKNADGTDSLESSRRDQNLRACRWLEAAGVKIPRTKDGRPDVTVTISPLFALGFEDLKDRADSLPELKPDDEIFLRP